MMNPMSGFDIRLVFTLAPRDSTLLYKDVYTSEMTFLALHPWLKQTLERLPSKSLQDCVRVEALIVYKIVSELRH